jgi:hypothetical protein
MRIQDEEDTIWVNENGYLLFFISEKKHNFGRDFLFLIAFATFTALCYYVFRVVIEF